MITSELHTSFKIELDKLSISSYPSFLPEEIDHFLNKANLIVIAKKFTGHNKYREGFEGNQKIVSDLAKLVKSTSNNAMTCSGSPSSGAIANDFLYFIDGSLKYKSTIGGSLISSNVIPITHNDSLRFKKTRTNNPVIIDPVMTQDSSGFKIYYDELTTFPVSGSVMTFDYDYIKTPAKIDFYLAPTAALELSDETQLEVVALAVLLAIENIESQRVATNTQTLNIQE
jgi:hypothetical protein